MFGCELGLKRNKNVIKENVCFNVHFRCVNREYGYYGDPDDPQKYFVCLPYTKQRHGKSLGGKLGLGRKWEFTCGPGTTFSEKHLTCV